MKFNDKAQTVAESIIKAFESGQVPAALANVFLSVKGRHAAGYSWMNQMIVALAGHADAMGYKGWLTVGRQVRKGQTAFCILAPNVASRADDKAPNGKRTFITGFRATNVFGNLTGLLLTLMAGIGATLCLAVLSWHFFEAPILRLRERLEAGTGINGVVTERQP